MSVSRLPSCARGLGAPAADMYSPAESAVRSELVYVRTQRGGRNDKPLLRLSGLYRAFVLNIIGLYDVVGLGGLVGLVCQFLLASSGFEYDSTNPFPHY